VPNIPVPTAPSVCPECAAPIIGAQGFVVWCERCNWNLEPHKSAPPRTLVGASYARLGARLGLGLFEELRQAQSLRPTITPSLASATLFAVAVHLLSVGLVVLGAVLVVTNWPLVPMVLFGLLLFGCGVFLFPRKVAFPLNMMPRDRFPALYETAGKVAGAVGARPPYAIALSLSYNASYRRSGWLRRQVLTLGIPMLAILDDREVVALIAHEMAHGVNGDATRGFFIGSAVETLTRWYVLLYPAPSRMARHGDVTALVTLLSKPVMLLAAQVPRIAAISLTHLLWRNMQRAEYLADYLAAKAAGTEAMLALMDKTHLEPMLHHVVQQVAIGGKEGNVFDLLRRQCDTLPSLEWKRIRAIARLEASTLDSTHPPTRYRMAMLEAHLVSHPSVQITLEGWRAFQRELAATESSAQKGLVENFRARL
jgi:Zn-dependent protease with chaperone function